jgi:hypothetical protein
MAACRTNYATSCMNGLMAQWTGNSPDLVEGCAQAIPGWACGDFIDNLNPPSACLQPTGAAPDTSPCAFPGQCMSGFCAMDLNAQCGACGAAPLAGADCSHLANCGQGLTCTRDTNVCVVPAAMGKPCGKGVPCAFELDCVGSTSTAMGTCQPAGTTAGTKCDPMRASAAGCAGAVGLYCDATSMQCAAFMQVAAGQPCGALDGGRVECLAAARCLGGGDGGGVSTCLAPAAEGSPCMTANGPGCLGPDRCIVTTTDGGTSGTCGQTLASVCP